MRTGRSLSVLRGRRVPGLGGYLVLGVYLVWGEYLVRGVPGPGGYLIQGVHLVLGGVPGLGGCPPGTLPGTRPGTPPWTRSGTPSGPDQVHPPGPDQVPPPPVNRITDRCKNINLAQLRATPRGGSWDVPSAPPDPPLPIIFNLPESYAKALTAIWQTKRVLTWILINDDEALILAFWLSYHFSTTNTRRIINRIGCWLWLNTRLCSQGCQFTEIQNCIWKRNN